MIKLLRRLFFNDPPRKTIVEEQRECSHLWQEAGETNDNKRMQRCSWCNDFRVRN